MFDSLLMWPCPWGIVAELSVLLDDPFLGCSYGLSTRALGCNTHVTRVQYASLCTLCMCRVRASATAPSTRSTYNISQLDRCSENHGEILKLHRLFIRWCCMLWAATSIGCSAWKRTGYCEGFVMYSQCCGPAEHFFQPVPAGS
jgi:hypothetical protein